MVIRVSALALVCALVLGSAPSHAGVIDKAQKAEAAEHQTWSAWGGDIGFRWNRGLLGNIGMRIEASPTGQTPNSLRGHEWFDVREAGGLDVHRQERLDGAVHRAARCRCAAATC